MTSYEKRLAGSPGLVGASRDVIRFLARHGELVEIPEGGNTWSGPCVVLSGEGDAVTFGSSVRLRPGSWFARRTAIVVARSPMRVLEIDRRAVHALQEMLCSA